MIQGKKHTGLQRVHTHRHRHTPLIIRSLVKRFHSMNQDKVRCLLRRGGHECLLWTYAAGVAQCAGCSRVNEEEEAL